LPLKGGAHSNSRATSSAFYELKTALKMIAEEELLTFADIFTAFDTCV
jgi:hypothetical protein